MHFSRFRLRSFSILTAVLLVALGIAVGALATKMWHGPASQASVVSPDESGGVTAPQDGPVARSVPAADTGADGAHYLQTQAKKVTRVKTAPPAKISAEGIAANRTFGSKDAPITVDEFSDYECHACRQLYLQTVRPMLDDYVASGKVYLVYHDFPLPIHHYSRDAAHYADAAAAIGKFDPVEEVLFNKQAEWSANGKVEDAVATVLTAAEMKRVQELLHNDQIDQVIEQDTAMGRQLGVNQTPTMFVTHKGQRSPVVGVVSYQILKMYFDNLMRQ